MRRKRSDRPVEKNLSLPSSIVDKVNEQLNDPLTGRPPHSAWAKLVTALLNKWLDGEVKVALPTPKKRTLDDLL